MVMCRVRINIYSRKTAEMKSLDRWAHGRMDISLELAKLSELFPDNAGGYSLIQKCYGNLCFVYICFFMADLLHCHPVTTTAKQ